MEETKEFLDILHDCVERNQGKVFATWYNHKGKPTDEYTFQQMWDEAGVIAHNLRILEKLNKGDRVILCYNFGLQFFAAFLGCLRGGIVAIPVYPPSPQNLPKALAKLTNIIQDSDAKLILVDNICNLLRLNPLSKSRSLWPQTIKYQVHPKNSKMSPLTNKSMKVLDAIIQKDPITPNDLAFLQYTSGSTGNPKGVMVTFKAVNANVQGTINEACRVYKSANASMENIVGFSWLPQYHDMGLIYTTIVPFAAGWNCNMISPLDFIKNPLLWIDLISRLHVNWSVAPNFAYRLAARKFMEAKNSLSSSSRQSEPIPNLDLSSVVYLQNAAEPIQLDTKDIFQQTFGPYGLRDNWFMSGYGLAESVVCVTPLHEYHLSTLEPTQGGQPSVAVGHRKFFFKGHDAKIVCPITFQELKDQQVGELWLSGPSIAAGYFGKPQLTNEAFQAKIKQQDSDDVYLRTGDLAFFEDDYLYICGRHKDLIIVNGVNHYPQDIENAVENASNAAVRPGCVAAFSSNDTGADGDLEVVFEIRKEFIFDAADIVNTVRKNIIDEIGIVPTRVVAIKERTILKTTSGKIQRKANRKALHDGDHKILFEYDPTKICDSADTKNEMSCQEQIQNYDPFDQIMVSFFGLDYDGRKTWDELGLSSMATLSLRDKIADVFAITLDPECFETYSTPDALKAFVLGNQGSALEVNLPLLQALDNNSCLSWSLLGFLQAFCSAMLLVLLAASILPPWFVGKLLANTDAYHTEVQTIGSNDTYSQWVWFPIAVPLWMLSFSLYVIVLKWVVIGKYKEGIVPIPSVIYLRWWFVDRAVALWEAWVGRFIVETPLINLFYFFMGSKIHWTVSIEAFIREFDLVEINQNSSLQFQIHCRKFDKWGSSKQDATNTPSLRFRHVSIGENCTIKGMVSLGAIIGDNAIVDRLSVVPQGAKVPQGTHVTGNPAYIITEENIIIKTRFLSYQLLLLGFLKLAWLAFELYLFFGIMFLGQNLWVSCLSKGGHRYTELLEWTLLLIAWFSVVSIFTSIILKWVLIGKRRPGSASTAAAKAAEARAAVDDTPVWRTFADWAADWHFQFCLGFLINMTMTSRFWNFILKMHGMDIDIKSQIIEPEAFLPSKVDLIKVKNSFLSSFTFNPTNNGHYYEISIENSSIGFRVDVSPDKDNLTISGSIVPPMTNVTSSITPEKPDPRKMKCTTFDVVWHETILTLGYLVAFSLLFCTLIPLYELCIYTFDKTLSIWLVVPTLAFIMALQTLLWALVLRFIQFVTFLKSRETGRPWSNAFYSLYITLSFVYQFYSFIYTLLGSPAFNFMMTLLGVQIEEGGNHRALLFPQRIFEFCYITISDRTIMDGAHVTGHYIVYNDMKVGPCKISGVLHEGCYVSHTVITSEESESLRTYMGTPNSTTPRRPHIDGCGCTAVDEESPVPSLEFLNDRNDDEFVVESSICDD